MDTNDSTVYVAKLMQQLEELKKKRARRLQRLEKLKKPSSRKKDSLVEDIPYHKAESIPPHTSAKAERQDSAEAKCAKCRLCLISKDSPCIQCLRAGNKHQENSENIIATLRAEPTNSENRLNSSPKLDRNNDFKPVKENINQQNPIYEKVLYAPNSSVLEPSLNSRTLANLNETSTNDSHQVSRKQKKRSSTLEDELKQDDHKKLKFSREDFQEKNVSREVSRVKNDPNYSYSATRDHSNEGSAVSSAGIHVSNEQEDKPQVANTVEVVEDSLLHNMSCFLSSGLLGEEEDNSGVDKQSILAGSEMDQTKDKSDLKSSTNEETVLSGSIKVNGMNNSEVNDLIKTSCCSAQADRSTLDTPVPLLPFNGMVNNVLDTFSDAGTPQCMPNLENILVKDFNHSKQMHNSTLCSAIGTQGGAKVEVSTPALEKNNDFIEVCEDTFNCLPEVNEVKSDKHEPKAKETMQSDSQLIEDLKASDFSSFENSNSAENLLVLVDVNPEKTEENHTPSLLDSSERMTANNMFNNIVRDKPYSENSNALVKEENGMDNETPDLLHNANVESKDDETEGHSLNCVPETSALDCNRSLLEIGETENLFVDDALTADIDFECTSLEVADTMDSLLIKSCNKNGLAVSPDKSIKSPAKHTSINVTDEVFTIPETELLNESHFNKTKIGFNKFKDMNQNRVTKDCIPSKMEELGKVLSACDIFDETQCDTLDQLQTIQDSVFLEAEDSTELGNYKNIPFAENEVKKTSSSDLDELHDAHQTTMKCVCCLQSDIDEPVNDIKVVFFNNSSYVFIQHVTWIQVWRQEENRNWTKIFAHQVDNELTLKEICFTKDACHLVLVILLCNDQVHCLQFLLFESEARVIKLMEHTHWLQNRCPNETVLLCGLGDLKFATAQGKETFDVFLHVFSSLRDNPRLMMATLGSTTGILHSLCSIEKLPNALMGTGNNMLHVWHLLEARLVTSVCLELPDPLSMINRCIWATIENGLVFLMTLCESKEGSRSCHLLATNLATGFCQIAMTYSFLPSLEKPRTSNLKTVYHEPFLAAVCDDGGFLWSVTDEYCCAALEAKDNITSISIGSDSDAFLVAVGNDTGCVNCYDLKCN